MSALFWFLVGVTATYAIGAVVLGWYYWIAPLGNERDGSYRDGP